MVAMRPSGLGDRGCPEAEREHVSVEFRSLQRGIDLETKFFGKLNGLDFRSADVRVPRDPGIVAALNRPSSDRSAPEGEAWGESKACKAVGWREGLAGTRYQTRRKAVTFAIEQEV